MNDLQQTVVSYVRRQRGPQKNQPVGAIIGRRNMHGNVVIGWSLTHTKAGDHFNKERALEIAIGRCDNGTTKTVPHAVKKQVETGFRNRVAKYFKVPAEEIVLISPPPKEDKLGEEFDALFGDKAQ